MRWGLAAIFSIACTPSAPAPGGSTAPTGSVSSVPAEEVTPIPGEQAFDGVDAVPIAGAEEVRCTARFVREHVRVSCPPFQGSAPRVEPGKADQYLETGRRNDSATAQTALRRGTDVSVTFVWGARSQTLRIVWPVDQPSRPPAWGVFSKPEEASPSPCPRGGAGRGIFSDPCLFSGASPLLAIWGKKYEPPIGGGEPTPAFEVDNTTDQPVTWVQACVYYYDAGGKQLDVEFMSSPNKRANVSLSLSDSNAIPAKAKRTLSLGVAQKLTPKTTSFIEAEIVGYEQMTPGLAWKGTELCKEDRARSRVK